MYSLETKLIINFILTSNVLCLLWELSTHCDFPRASHQFLSWSRCIQPTPSQPIACHVTVARDLSTFIIRKINSNRESCRECWWSCKYNSEQHTKTLLVYPTEHTGPFFTIHKNNSKFISFSHIRHILEKVVLFLLWKKIHNCFIYISCHYTATSIAAYTAPLSLSRVVFNR
jgi:hypothetical protein